MHIEVDVAEGETMIFIRKTTTTVTVSQVSALFNDAESGENYIVMKRIHGDTLDLMRSCCW